jgi:hypothetical protein
MTRASIYWEGLNEDGSTSSSALRALLRALRRSGEKFKPPVYNKEIKRPLIPFFSNRESVTAESRITGSAPFHFNE